MKKAPVLWGKSRQVHTQYLCYHSTWSKLGDKMDRFCPWPFPLYTIFLRDSSILSWLYHSEFSNLLCLTLASPLGSRHDNISSCQQDIPTSGSHRPPIFNMSRAKVILLPPQPAFQPVSSLSWWNSWLPSQPEIMVPFWLIPLSHFLFYISHGDPSLPSLKCFCVVASQVTALVHHLIGFHPCCCSSPRAPFALSTLLLIIVLTLWSHFIPVCISLLAPQSLQDKVQIS